MAETGRPTVMTEDVLHKLEEAFLLGCTDEEATFYADIGMSTLYKYQNEHPEFVDRKEQLKNNPIFLARKSVIEGFSNHELALKFLERKKKDEFSLRQELVGKDGGALVPNNDEEIKELSNKFNEFLKQHS